MEEASLSTSCTNKPFSIDDHSTLPSASAEESGWTIYFEDFFASEKREEFGHSCTASNSVGGSSLVSDAASCAAWKFPATVKAGSATGSRKKLSFKKRKARGVFDEDPLEDTASSPRISPKV